MVGAVILGGIFEGVVGLSAKYWKKYLTPVVSACVVIAIGLSLLPVGMNSWGGGSGSESFRAWHHLLVGGFTLVVCLVSRYLLKGVYKNLNILVGLIFGYILSGIFTAAGIAPMIDFSGISKTIGEVGAGDQLGHLLPAAHHRHPRVLHHRDRVHGICGRDDGCDDGCLHRNVGA